jgi:hypothetical protein
MQGFNQELQIGHPALIINVEYSKNSHFIGTTIVIESLLTPDESDESIFGANGHAYAVYLHDDGTLHYIRQKYLMPIPPLDDQTYSEDVSVNNNKEVHA